MMRFFSERLTGFPAFFADIPEPGSGELDRFERGRLFQIIQRRLDGEFASSDGQPVMTMVSGEEREALIFGKTSKPSPSAGARR